jgi:hypothetical protein
VISRCKTQLENRSLSSERFDRSEVGRCACAVVRFSLFVEGIDRRKTEYANSQVRIFALGRSKCEFGLDNRGDKRESALDYVNHVVKNSKLAMIHIPGKTNVFDCKNKRSNEECTLV